MREKIRDYFTKTIDNYDTVAPKVIMKYGELHSVLVGALPLSKEDPITILDLGCGTGHGISLILQEFPNSVVHGVDFSPKMIATAEANLKAYSKRTRLLEVSFEDMKLDATYDGVVSAIAIHNCDDEVKRVIFQKVYDALLPGGVFINGDFIKAESDEIDRNYLKIYQAFLKDNLQGDELQVWLDHALQDDKPMHLTKQLKTLREIGFREVSIIWQYNNEVIYLAKK